MKTNRAAALRQETSKFKPKNGEYTAPFPYAAALIAAIYFLSLNHLPILDNSHRHSDSYGFSNLVLTAIMSSKDRNK
jgi:hypothetical protein